MERFTLVGVDGNIFAVIGYTASCLKKVGLRDKVDEMTSKAMSSKSYYEAL